MTGRPAGGQHSRGVPGRQIPVVAGRAIFGIVDGELLKEVGGIGPVAAVEQFHPPGEPFAELLVGGPDGLAPAEDLDDLDRIGLARQHERSEPADEQCVEPLHRCRRGEQPRGEQLVHVLDARRRIGGIPHRLQFAGDGTEADLARIEADARGHPLRDWMRRVETIDGVSYFNRRQTGVQPCRLLLLPLPAQPSCERTREPEGTRRSPDTERAVAAAAPDKASTGRDQPAEHLVVLVQQVVQFIASQVLRQVGVTLHVGRQADGAEQLLPGVRVHFNRHLSPDVAIAGQQAHEHGEGQLNQQRHGQRHEQSAAAEEPLGQHHEADSEADGGRRGLHAWQQPRQKPDEPAEGEHDHQ